MRTFTLPLILATSIGLAVPAAAQTDFENIIDGLAQGLIQQELDRTAYIAAQRANTVTGYRDYLKRYPKGAYRTNAEQALARLGAPVEETDTTIAARVEQGLRITTRQRIAVQQELTRLGYNTRGTDGVWGRSTRAAIAAWQRDTGATVTGYVTGAQLRTLLQSGVVAPPDEPPSDTLAAAKVEAALKLTRSQRITIQKQLTALGHDAGIADGLWGSRTRNAIMAWQRANRRAASGYVNAAQVKLIAQQAGEVAPVPPTPTDAAAIEEELLGLTVRERSDLQRRLTRLGYDTDGASGTFNRTTRRAIAAWQKDERAAVTGYFTADQVRRIRVDTGG